MALRTPEEYVVSLRDGRTVYYKGERVPDVTAHPVIQVAIEHASIDYRMAEDPQWKDLATVKDEETGRLISRYYRLPRSSDDLLRRSALIEQATRLGRTLVVLIKEIGTDALFALHILAKQMDDRLGTKYLERVRRYHAYCQDNDLALAVAQTDVKGDRSLAPSEQPDLDLYVHIVGEGQEGIRVRGAKVHTSVSTNANEIIVLPTRALGERDRDYAVSFAVPVNTKGLTLIAAPYGATRMDTFDHPISSRHRMMETLTVFDDVLVPWDRVFLKGEWQFAGPLALTFVEFHRFTAISYKLPLVDLLVGCARLMAEYNGLEKVSHIREKMIHLISYAETLRALTHHAALQSRMVEPGIAVPSQMLVNIAKHHFASHYHQAVQWVQDVSGGLVVTGPSGRDLQSPEIGPLVKKYLAGKKGISGDKRLQAFKMVRDLTASDFGGYQEVLAVHAEGSIEAEKLALFRAYDSRAAYAYAKWVAGIED
ncbi:MAG TPA: 4-hydroxyphenylacetate 3-hydroxylase N-terminal domain-containing protein [Candidatus Methylomirabilis sp.]|nr:4-hydroxyphenylacetate 3-hydroxylase N-terminal domain-containing protein [Candidatus Methylomirabilis sp.]